MTTSHVARRSLYALASVALLGAAGGNPEKHAKAAQAEHVLVKPSDVRYQPGPPGLPKGAQMAVLEGDPSAAGKYFTVRVKLPAHYRIAPHSHSTDEHITVLSGELGMGMGERFDAAKAEKLAPGGYFTLPAGAVHYAVAEKETVLQLQAMGPFDIKYVNPADDPRNAAPSASSSAPQR